MIDPQATIERSRSLADEQCWSVALQVRRLRTEEPEDQEFEFRRIADFHFLVIALGRLRKAAKIMTTVPECQAEVDRAIDEFDGRLPGLRRMRNVGEHVESYGVDSPHRHDAGVDRRMLQVASWDEESFTWLGETIHAPSALDAARRLYLALRQAQANYASEPGTR